MEDPKLKIMAEKYKKSTAQILLRFSIQRGLCIIPKSSKKHRMIENGNIFDFSLENGDMEALLAMDKNQRYFPMVWFDHRFYPFRENYTEN